MGSGKSTAGKILAKELECRFLDLDEYIEQNCERDIPEIFNTQGESSFRVIESESLAEVSDIEEDCVISTGGGIVISDANWEIMKNSGTTVYLETELDTIWERISDEGRRPLLEVENPYEAAKKLLSGRLKLYEKADYKVKTDGESPEDIAEKIKGLA